MLQGVFARCTLRIETALIGPVAGGKRDSKYSCMLSFPDYGCLVTLTRTMVQRPRRKSTEAPLCHLVHYQRNHGVRSQRIADPLSKLPAMNWIRRPPLPSPFSLQGR